MSFFFSSDWPRAEKPYSVAIIRAEFHDDLTTKLLENTLKGLRKCNISEGAIEIFEVPGALETAFAARKILDTNDFDGILVLGLVLRGETYHFEVVSNESARALTELNLEANIPVVNGILTLEAVEQFAPRLEKGMEFAKTLVRMMNFTSIFESPAEQES